MNQRWRPYAIAGMIAVTTLSLTGCAEDWKRGGLPQGITDQSQTVQNLWIGSWIAAAVVGIGVWGLIFWACFAYRRKSAHEPLPAQVRYNVPIEALYSVLPFIIIAVMFSFIARDQNSMMNTAPNPDKVVTVVGRQWSWDFNYTSDNVYDTGTPDELPVLYLPKGQRVRFVLESRDVIHSFWIPAFLFKLDVVPGRTNVFEATPDKVGTFAGKCAELCGQDHARMLFTAKVVEPAEYQAHMEQLRAVGKTGSLPVVELGPNELGVRDAKENAP